MIYDPSITYTKSMGVPALKRAAISKGELEGWQTSQIQLKRKDVNLLAYLNEDKWFDGWGEKKPAKVKKPVSARPTAGKSNTSATEFQYDLLSGITTPAPVNVEPSSMLPPHPGSSPIPATEPISAVEVVNAETPGLVNPPLPVEGISPPLVNIPLPVTAVVTSAVNPPLPVMKSLKSHKGMLANGRSSKGVPSFDKWFGRSYPSNVAYPAWKYLTKTSTDVANICIAKHDHAASCNKKDSSGFPWFEFSFKEAVAAFKISRPTFDKSIKQLVEIGFIKYVVIGGIPQRGNFVDGRGTPAQYQLSQDWKTWSQDENKAQDQGNMGKLVALSQKQNPGKPVFTPTSKHTFTSGAE